MRTLSSGARWWRRQIEARTEQRLRELVLRGLWDGRPPVPVDHVAEHLLDLTICWEDIDEPEGEEVLGCLRPHRREIVLNERRMERLQVPGVLRFTMSHEIGHADVFALADQATTQIGLALNLGQAGYRPRHRSSPTGELAILVTRVTNALQRAGASRERRRAAYEAIHAEEQARVLEGADTAIEASAVNHYASCLLMPADLLGAEAAPLDLTQRSALRALATRFEVSGAAMQFRLEHMGLIYGVDETGRVLLRNPATEAQAELF